MNNMNILDLNYECLHAIIYLLDINSFKSIRLTCAQLNEVAMTSMNISKWRYEIKKMFIFDKSNFPVILENYNRSEWEVSLKALLNVLRYIIFFKHIQANYIDMPEVTLRLLIEGAPIDTTSVELIWRTIEALHIKNYFIGIHI